MHTWARREVTCPLRWPPRRRHSDHRDRKSARTTAPAFRGRGGTSSGSRCVSAEGPIGTNSDQTTFPSPASTKTSWTPFRLGRRSVKGQTRHPLVGLDIGRDHVARLQRRQRRHRRLPRLFLRDADEAVQLVRARVPRRVDRALGEPVHRGGLRRSPRRRGRPCGSPGTAARRSRRRILPSRRGRAGSSGRCRLVGPTYSCDSRPFSFPVTTRRRGLAEAPRSPSACSRETTPTRR